MAVFGDWDAAMAVSSEGGRRKRGEEEAEAKDKDEDEVEAQPKMKKLVLAMAKCTMQLVDENRNVARIDNIVLQSKVDGAYAKLMRKQEEDYAKEGKAARAKAEEEGADFRGHPHGKKPDVLGRALMVRLSQFLQQPETADKIKAAGPALQAIKNVVAFGERAKTDAMIRCQRAFRVEVEIENVATDKWIFFFPRETVMNDLRILMHDRSLEKVGVTITEDFAPRTAAAKEVAALAFNPKNSKGGPSAKKKAKKGK